MSEHTRTYAVQVGFVISLAGDESSPIPTDPNELKRILAEEVANCVNAYLYGGGREIEYEGLVELIDDVQVIAEDDVPVTSQTQVIPFTMPLENGDEPGEIAGRIEIGNTGVEIFLDGYGVEAMDPGHGSVIYLNHYDGSPQVVIHGDIRQQDYTHKIQLAAASEEWRDDPGAMEPLFENESRFDHEDRRNITTHTTMLFAGKVGDRVVVRDPDSRKAYEGKIEEIIPAQAGFNPMLVSVTFDDGGTDMVNPADIEEIIEEE